MGEAGLGLVSADLAISGEAFRASTAGADEGDGHSLADPESVDPRADRVDHADQFVARNVRKADSAVVSKPAVYVAAAESCRLDPNHDSPWTGDRIGHLAQSGAFREPVE
jgi:hypothetical protein